MNLSAGIVQISSFSPKREEQAENFLDPFSLRGYIPSFFITLGEIL
jgi:hypothetical protein